MAEEIIWVRMVKHPQRAAYEVVALAPAAVAEQRMEHILEIMRRVPAWATGLPLNGEAYCASRMQK
jgi:hypothetical protein